MLRGLIDPKKRLARLKSHRLQQQSEEVFSCFIYFFLKKEPQNKVKVKVEIIVLFLFLLFIYFYFYFFIKKKPFQKSQTGDISPG